MVPQSYSPSVWCNPVCDRSGLSLAKTPAIETASVCENKRAHHLFLCLPLLCLPQLFLPCRVPLHFLILLWE
jgi:hypothetical protein